MGEVTLESLAKRVEELEREVAELRDAKPSPLTTPGTGNWEAALQAARELAE